MTSLQRLKQLRLSTRVSLLNSVPSKSNLYSNGVRFICAESVDRFKGGHHCRQGYLVGVWREAQSTLTNYLHQSRKLPLQYAELLSRNSPQFLGRLLDSALKNGGGDDVGLLLTRFLSCNPVNEFEPFFEIIGLGPYHYASFLPGDSISINDDELLLHNYHVLCNYGVERYRIGRIYMGAKEVFSYDHGVLQSRLRSLQNCYGLQQSLVAVMVAASPRLLLRGDGNREFDDFLRKLKYVGIDLDLLEKHIRGIDSCDWKCMLEVLCLFRKLGFTKEKSREVITSHPRLLVERSGIHTLCLFSLLLKFGLDQSGVREIFCNFPEIPVASFTENLLQCYQFLVKINIPSHDIGRMVRMHPLLLGSCKLKGVATLAGFLNCGVNRIRKMVEADPYVLNEWVLGVRVDPLPEPSWDAGNITRKRYGEVWREAQDTMLEYFQLTRNLPFVDAESLSRNSPEFLGRMLKNVLSNGDGGKFDVGRLLAQFLRYHPVNEFEPFFESIGLEPCEYASFLPRDLIFLNDDELLLQNYHVLCDYGVEKNRIGKIFVEANEVFSYDPVILQSRLQSLQNCGLPHSLVAEMIVTNPELLRGHDYQKLRDFLKKLKNVGIDLDWLEEHMRGGDSCDWKCMLEVVCLLSELGFTEEQSGEVIVNRPDLLLSSSCTLCFFSILLKFGSRNDEIRAVFRNFPEVSTSNFTRNLLQSYQFLVDVNMSSHDIARMFCLHPLLLGTLQLQKVHIVTQALKCGVDELREKLESDPHVLKKWVLGVRIGRPPRFRRVTSGARTSFVEALRLVGKSGETERSERLFREHGDELQERFSCLTKCGLSQKNAAAIVRSAPQILHMSKDVIERKIELLIRDFGFPVSLLLDHPVVLAYSPKRLKLRCLMYKWLKDEGLKIESNVTTLMTYNETKFMKHYVNSHPKGAQVWERMKKKMDV